MRIAYLILCHKNPAQVKALINQLNNGTSDFYLHVDKKTAITDFILKKDNVFYVNENERENIKWASFEMVSATIKLMKMAKKSNIRYDYIILLSGQDLPIKSNKDIHKYLEEHQGVNFIEVLDHSHKNYQKYLKRNAIRYYKWMFSDSAFIKALKKLYILITGGHYYTIPIFKRKKPFNFEFEFGSQWWAFTYECFCWILDYIDSNSDFSKFYQNSLTADESFFQTLFMASPYKNQRNSRLTYLEMGRNHPRVFTKEEYGALVYEHTELFARKFDFVLDNDISIMIKD